MKYSACIDLIRLSCPIPKNQQKNALVTVPAHSSTGLTEDDDDETLSSWHRPSFATKAIQARHKIRPKFILIPGGKAWGRSPGLSKMLEKRESRSRQTTMAEIFRTFRTVTIVLGRSPGARRLFWFDGKNGKSYRATFLLFRQKCKRFSLGFNF